MNAARFPPWCKKSRKFATNTFYLHVRARACLREYKWTNSSSQRFFPRRTLFALCSANVNSIHNSVPCVFFSPSVQIICWMAGGESFVCERFFVHFQRSNWFIQSDGSAHWLMVWWMRFCGVLRAAEWHNRPVIYLFIMHRHGRAKCLFILCPQRAYKHIHSAAGCFALLATDAPALQKSTIDGKSAQPSGKVQNAEIV